MGVEDRKMDWAGPVAQLVTAALAALALYKAFTKDKTEKSVRLIELEAKARESLAERYDVEMVRCNKECDALRTELTSERSLRRKLEDRVEKLERENRKLKIGRT